MAARVIWWLPEKAEPERVLFRFSPRAALLSAGGAFLLIELDSGLRSVDYIAGIAGKTAYDIGDILDGRCDAGKAIVESPLYKGLYVVSAPYSGGVIRVDALAAFVKSAQQVFDDVFLDTAAGMGVPFLSAMSVSTMGLIVVTPDPVAIRDGRIVCDALCEHGVDEMRLVINKVPARIEDCGVDDLDECIDTVGAQLLGVVPLRQAVADAGAYGVGLAPPEKEVSHAVFHAMAARLCGEQVPLLIR